MDYTETCTPLGSPAGLVGAQIQATSCCMASGCVSSHCTAEMPTSACKSSPSDDNRNSLDLESVCATASALADIYINELLNESAPDAAACARPRFARKFVRLTREVEMRHKREYEDMCKGLMINSQTVYPIFTQISGELFKSGVNWGRLLGLYAFAGALCRVCNSNGMSSMVTEIKIWLVAYARGNLAMWIIDHGGWVSCIIVA